MLKCFEAIKKKLIYVD